MKPKKVAYRVEPTRVERAAQHWHAARQRTGEAAHRSEGWHLCPGCRFDNPHRAEAITAAVVDLSARVNELYSARAESSAQRIAQDGSPGSRSRRR
jgi:hypothetical protein